MNLPTPLHPNAATEICLSKGDILYREGDVADCGYVIETGQLLVFNTKDGRRNEIERRGHGSIIGEFSILTGQPRAVTAQAVTDCRIYKISAQQILHRFDKIDPVLRACIDTTIEFMGALNSEVANSDASAPLVPTTLRNADEILERFKFEQDILNGLGTDQFSLAYQPIVRLQDGSIVGFEALMRWQHPTIGNIPPFKFIDVAEAMGSICTLTNFALMEACGALRRFIDQNPTNADLYASVNISADDLERPDFVDFLAHALDMQDLQPHHLKIEVTETAIVSNTDTAAKNLARLKNFGCGLSIDDFGTGYSNMAYLKKLPLTALKIDRAFAGDACKNSVSYSIVKMLIGLGRELGVDVIAEGLETQCDVDTLQGLGCDYAQGYHFSKPVTETEFAAYLNPQNPAQRSVA